MDSDRAERPPHPHIDDRGVYPTCFKDGTWFAGKLTADRAGLKHARYLQRVDDIKLTDQQVRVLTYREQGYTPSTIVSKIGSTEGTARNHLKWIATRYGLEVIETKVAGDPKT